MIALDVAKTYPRPDRSYGDAFDALVYLLECNFATLEDLEMKTKPVKSKVRRQRSICETGLFTLHAHTPTAYATAKRLRCMRVAEILKKPTRIEVLQNEDVARIDVHFGSTSLVAHVGSVSTGLNPFDKGWVARLYVNGSCVYVDNHDADSQAGRDRLARVLTQYVAVAIQHMPDPAATRDAIARHPVTVD